MDFNTKANIVAECWLVTRNHDAWQELIKYGDLGFPLAYAVTENVATVSEKGVAFIEELYDLIVATLDINPDMEYEDFEAMLDANIEKFGGDNEDEKQDN